VWPERAAVSRHHDFCLRGDDQYCDSYAGLGGKHNGGYAEYVVVPAVNLFPKPDHLTFVEAAALPLTTLTAWRALVSLCQVRPGENVLVQAVGSGVGVMLLQIARVFGARVIGTAGSDEKLERAQGLGLDAGINYERSDFVAEVQRLTGGKGVEIVCEQVGGSVFERSLEALARGGRLVIYGATSGGRVQLDNVMLQGRRATIFYSVMGARRELYDALQLVRAGRLQPVVDRVFPLAEAAAAQQFMLDRRNFGKIVLAVDPSAG
jgi:NADPH:quinone reductase-like Zn-dependent oxidoreductase